MHACMHMHVCVYEIDVEVSVACDTVYPVAATVVACVYMVVCMYVCMHVLDGPLPHRCDRCSHVYACTYTHTCLTQSPYAHVYMHARTRTYISPLGEGHAFLDPASLVSTAVTIASVSEPEFFGSGSLASVGI
jgi:hypothetical protein